MSLFATQSATAVADRTQQVISKAEALVDIALQEKLFSRKEAQHLKEDLEELKAEVSPKEGQPTFEHMMREWDTFIVDAERQLKFYQELPAAEKKIWKTKIETPLYFATGHFVAFLETRDSHFGYQRMNQILETVNKRQQKDDFRVFIYLFEQQVRKFSSLRDFRRCLS